MDLKYFEFPVTIYSILEPISPVMSKARCRIFYKGLNRNGSYITDEFAEKLVSTLPYVPVKGIYEEDDEDFTDHGAERSLGRIYGIVPESNNFAWEQHLDKDGVTRTYACTDVYLYTALYEEALKIPNKGQSMEIFPPSIKGDWTKKDGQQAFVYSDGCFLGLQVLGDNVEPCFEGSAFFSLYQDFKNLMNDLKEVQTFNNKKEEVIKMDKLTFKLSDGQKEEALWALLNSKFNEENGWVIEYGICAVYDTYAVVRQYESGKYSRVYYTKNDTDETVTIDKQEDCFIVDVNAEEKNALETLRALKGTYAASLEEYNTMKTENENLKSEKENFDTKISELSEENSTLQTERDTFSTQVETLTQEKATLETEITSLKEYKLTSENNAKKAIISKYSEQLDEAVITEFTENIENYTIDALKKELAFALVGDNPENFSKVSTPRVPKDKEPSGLEAVLDQYKK